MVAHRTNQYIEQPEQLAILLDVTIPNCLQELHSLTQAVLFLGTNEKRFVKTLKSSGRLEKILRRRGCAGDIEKVRARRAEQTELSLDRIKIITEKIAELKTLMAVLRSDLSGIRKTLAHIAGPTAEFKKKLSYYHKEAKYLESIVAQVDKNINRIRKTTSKGVKNGTNYK